MRHEYLPHRSTSVINHHDENQRKGMTVQRRDKSIVAAILLTAGLTMVSTTPAHAANNHEGKAPHATGCDKDAYTPPGGFREVYEDNGTIVGTKLGDVSLRYSPSCGTTWVRVQAMYYCGQQLDWNMPYLGCGTGYMTSSSGRAYLCEIGYNQSVCWSQMTDDRGSLRARAQGFFLNFSTVDKHYTRWTAWW
jgi:hypothetical protein